MLSYLHGFHAGNFADVHKHLLLCLLLQALNRKSKPWSYLETHSGSALYDFEDSRALKTAEFRDGIARLWEREALPEALAPYLEQVRQQNPDGRLRYYPGSPTLAAGMARADDRIRLMELHPNEVVALKQLFRNDERVAVHHRDGYEGVLSLLPPTPKRGLVLVDPAYEVKEEYRQVVGFIAKAMKRWPTGIYAIWYPLLTANRWQQLLEGLRRSGIRAILRAELAIAEAGAEHGMYGSGMLIINPPWQLDQQLATLLPELLALLEPTAPGTKPRGSTLVEWLVEE